MDDEHVAGAIAILERALEAEDPTFVAKFAGLERAQRVVEALTFALLAIGCVLLAAGFAVVSAPLWCGGVAAFLASFAADSLRRFRGSRCADAPLDRRRLR